jgi:hypothetical protein
MDTQLIYKGSIVDANFKQKRGYFFIEELFCGDFFNKAPLSLRKKIDADSLESIEIALKCYFTAPSNSKVIFQNYTHFKKTLEEFGINIKLYYS